jgi:hypothetical protein
MSDLLERIGRFVDDPAADDFDELALAAFAFQVEHSEPYRRWCDGRGARPGGVASWRDVPAVPTAAFKSLDLSTAAPGAAGVETFRSSGTRGGEAERSVHRHPHPDLYRRTVDAAFPRVCPLAVARPSMLALVPDREQAPDSSLAFMVDHLLRRWGGGGSLHAFGRHGVDARVARSWIGARQRDGRPALLLATAFALADLLDALERMGLRFRLPAGSAAMVTGGFKGQRREVAGDELAARLEARLGVPRRALFGEYGMTELTSQLYTGTLVGGDPDLYVAPPWVRVRVVDPATLADAPPGEAGLVAIFDLANLGSAVHLLSEDLGRLEGGGSAAGDAVTGDAVMGDGGLRLLGRAPGAELRGCSLAVEELTG